MLSEGDARMHRIDVDRSQALKVARTADDSRKRRNLDFFRSRYPEAVPRETNVHMQSFDADPLDYKSLIFPIRNQHVLMRTCATEHAYDA